LDYSSEIYGIPNSPEFCCKFLNSAKVKLRNNNNIFNLQMHPPHTHLKKVEKINVLNLVNINPTANPGSWESA
jgi:hypothetical protein